MCTDLCIIRLNCIAKNCYKNVEYKKTHFKITNQNVSLWMKINSKNFSLGKTNFLDFFSPDHRLVRQYPSWNCVRRSNVTRGTRRYRKLSRVATRSSKRNTREKCASAHARTRTTLARTRPCTAVRGARRVCHTWHTFAGKRAILLETVLTGSTTPASPSTSRPLLVNWRTRAYIACTEPRSGCVYAWNQEPRFKRRPTCLHLSDVHTAAKNVRPFAILISSERDLHIR